MFEHMYRYTKPTNGYNIIEIKVIHLNVFYIAKDVLILVMFSFLRYSFGTILSF